jgi:hypothetical protein
MRLKTKKLKKTIRISNKYWSVSAGGKIERSEKEKTLGLKGRLIRRAFYVNTGKYIPRECRALGNR